MQFGEYQIVKRAIRYAFTKNPSHQLSFAYTAAGWELGI